MAMLIIGIGAVCGATLLFVSLQLRSRRTLRAGRLRPVLAGSTALFAAAMLVVVMVGGGQGAGAIGVAVPLGTAESFAVLGGQSVTNTGPTVVWGDVGVAPGAAITGFPPGIFLGTAHSADAVAFQAQADVVTAYNNAAGQAPDALLPPDAGGLTLVGGVYNASSSLGLTGTLTLDAQGDPDTVWVFQVGSTLTTASGSSVSLINGAQACNVFWQIGSSATLGTASTFVGTVLALTSITATTAATIDGRLLARNGSVTLDTNTLTNSACLVVPPPTTSTTAVTTPSTVDTGGSTTIDAGGTTTPGGGGTTTPGAVPTTVGPPITPPGGGNLTIPPTLVTLPATGSETGGTAIAATILVALGVGVLAVARRRVHHH
jgi:LPXTG-motif cell wall-anchored protein